MFHLYGPNCCRGSYILRIDVSEPLRLSFGRFRGGEPISIRKGSYAYVGSAMGRRGPSSLARRLLRHATRCAGQHPHPIRESIMARFLQQSLPAGCRAKMPVGKRLHWHVDYLLDQPAANLSGVLAVRSAQRLEGDLAAILLSNANARPLAVGLGASDAPGETHLLYTPAEDSWWQALGSAVATLTESHERHWKRTKML